MSQSVVTSILQQRELRNEKTVAIVRSILSLTGFWEILALLQIVPPTSSNPSIMTAVMSSGFFVYASIILILLFAFRYLKYLKFFVIFFDYLYIGISFAYDPSLVANRDLITWLIFAGCIIFYMINLLRYSRASTVFAAFLSCFYYVFINLYYHIPGNVIAQIGIALAIVLLVGFLITSSNLKMLVEVNAKKMMERYLPPELVTEMYKQNPNLEPGGKTQNTTILFADIRSFTNISESLSADEVVRLLNSYLSGMTDIIFEQGGTIDKFIGDAIMTIFGAPVSHTDDPKRAVLTALKMHKFLPRFNQMHDYLKAPLRIGIGIHTGEVIAGNIGSDKRLDYTVIGDAVNLASRIEGLTKYYSCPVLISDATFTNLKDNNDDAEFVIREIDNVIVKGKTKNHLIYEVMSFENEEEKKIQEKLKKHFEQALQNYKNGNFHAALQIFEAFKDDGPSQIYTKRCQSFMQNPPPDNWNAIHILNVK